jgi:hypothetical protein
MGFRIGASLAAVLWMLAGCAAIDGAAPRAPLACTDELKTAFRPDAQTTVVAVRAVRRGEALVAVDSPNPITAADDLCLVKLLVGPGVAAEKDRHARSYSEGIGIEVWLPSHAKWNERIRNYGGGGWVGGGHRTPGQIGSKVPAIVNANVGYASGTTDAGQPWYQDGSFTFLSDGRVNAEAFRDFAERALVEQALKTKALVGLYYGKAAKYAYFDGHSQGGRQGMKIAQKRPELYDGYMIAQPALSAPSFGTAALYPQIVMKQELGYTAADKPKAAAFAKKVEAATRRAVASCDKPGLGFLLDPFDCSYDPARDAAALCAGVQGDGVVGTGSDAAACMSLAEANALNRIWYGATADGSWDAAQGADGRSGRTRGAQQRWWGLPRGSALGGLITAASTDNLALAMQDVRYAGSAGVASGIALTNASSAQRDKWLELDYRGLAAAMDRYAAAQTTLFHDMMTDQADLRRLRDLGRKVIVYSGLAEDVIPPSGNVHYHERVVAGMGGHEAVQRFMRMYLVPGSAHSSQGRPFAAAGDAAGVPLPRLPGNANQTPTREQDTFFSALVDWVEQGVAPQDVVVTSRDGSTSYPLCVYPQKITWNGGAPKQRASYACR